MVNAPFNSSTPEKILLNSVVIEGFVSKFLVIILSYLSKFSSLFVASATFCLNNL